MLRWRSSWLFMPKSIKIRSVPRLIKRGLMLVETLVEKSNATLRCFFGALISMLSPQKCDYTYIVLWPILSVFAKMTISTKSSNLFRRRHFSLQPILVRLIFWTYLGDGWNKSTPFQRYACLSANLKSANIVSAKQLAILTEKRECVPCKLRRAVE